MRGETRAALINTYLGMSDDDIRFKAVDRVLNSNTGDSVIDALSVALTDDASRLQTYLKFAEGEKSENAHLLAAELAIAEVVILTVGTVAQFIPGVFENE
jgi:hypothetical protein